MDENQGSVPGEATNRWADVAIRFALVAAIIYWSFLLLRPFLEILIWAAILSVALYPVYKWLQRVLGGRSTLASFLVTVVALLVILGPVSTIGAALVKNVTSLAAGVAEGTIHVPPPPPYVAEWPLIGEQLSEFWQTASEELGEALATIGPQLRSLATTSLGFVGNIGIALVQFIVAILIAGFTFSRAETFQKNLKAFAQRTAPGRGEGFVDLAGGTVRGVARGVVGISLVQAILFGIGAMIANVPLVGLWTFVALILAIVQVGPGLVIIPVIIYGWVEFDSVTAGILTAYLIPVMLMDNVLKPIVMGRGLPVPILVIFIGVIGGTMTHGLIGLFVGPIVLALGYELARAWVAMGRGPAET